jgi:hypothetical protein
LTLKSRYDEPLSSFGFNFNFAATHRARLVRRVELLGRLVAVERVAGVV